MRIILTENVPNLGFAGDIVSVKGGYARNFLLPRNKAMPADSRNIKAAEHAKLVAEHRFRKIRKETEQIAEKLRNTSLTISMKVGEEDKLFGAVTSMDIENLLRAEGFEIDRRNIHLEKPLKSLGEYIIPVKLHREVTADVKLTIIKE